MRRLLVLYILCGLALGVNAQEDEFRAAFDSFKQKARKDYEEFRDKANAEYAEFLKQAWKDFKTLPPVMKPKNEHVELVVATEADKQKPKEDKPIKVEEVIKFPEIVAQPVPVGPIREQKQTEATDKPMEFFLYGATMKVRVNDGLKFKLRAANEEAVSEMWKELSSGKYNNLMRDCLELRIRNKLCDWSYLRMLTIISDKLLGKNTNEAELLKAYIYCQSGYQMRLGFEGERLHMLYASDSFILGKSHYEIDGKHYFVNDVKADHISICKATYPKERALSMNVNAEQNLAVELSEEKEFANPEVAWQKAKVQVNEHFIQFYNDYPTSYFGNDLKARWALYANTPTSPQVKQTLYPQLREWIKGKTAINAIDILCCWLQKAFQYGNDDDAWGEDRAFFSDETLYYPTSDSEDRSILLTRLVRDLLGLRCALVFYPEHVATAIAVGEEVVGDFIRVDGTKFLICDPTYIEASLGMTKPGLDSQTAKVVVLPK